MRLPLLLDLVADTFPDRIAIRCGEAHWCYGTLRDASLGLAARLAGTQARNLGFLGMNSPAFPLALFAAGRADLTLAPLNYRLTDERLRGLAARLAPAVVIADDAMLHRLAGIEGVELLPTSAVLALREESGPPAAPDASEDNPTAVLLFTSGTSGEPKAALQGHHHLAAYVLQTVGFLAAEEEESALVSVPPYHIAAVSAVLSSVYGARCLVQLESFDAARWVDAARREAVTHAMVVPTMLEQILDLLRREDGTLPALRALAYGGGRMHGGTVLDALRRLPQVGLTNAYGLTETSSTITVLGPEEHEAARGGDPAAIARLASVGRPVPGIELEIRDDTGCTLPAGTRGEVCVRGEQVSGDYAGRDNGGSGDWFRTRDLGWLDAEGYLFLDGRLDDVIVRGGENISPGEIEEVLRAHPAVRDAAVVGTPDAHWGERVVAFVSDRDPAASDAELGAWVRERLRSTRVPAQIVRRAELPYNDTGKLLRRVLRDELAATPAASCHNDRGIA